MSIEMFLVLLFAFSMITSLIVEAAKKILTDKENFSYNMMALVVAVCVGLVGCFIYYKLNDMPITGNNAIYAFLLGGASGITSQVGFDKVKQTILQLGLKEKLEDGE